MCFNGALLNQTIAREIMRVLTILLACAVWLSLSSTAGATELRIHLQGPDGARPAIDRAELLLVGWGWTDRLALLPEGDNTLRLDFETRYSQLPEKFQNTETVQLYVHAENFAPMTSEPFEWLGLNRGNLSTETRIEFSGGRSITIRIGDTTDMNVALRRPMPRQIRLLDEDGKPISGLRISAYMFWSNRNHCGFLNGAEILRVASSDEEGRVVVPDGDFKYAFKLDYGSHYVFTDPPSNPDPPETYIMASLMNSETVLRLRKFRALNLSLHVVAGDEPVAGASIIDSKNCGVCGACSGVLGQTDGQGRLKVDRFYPEERDGICLVDTNGKLLWGRTSDELGPDSKTLEIRLPADTKTGTTNSPCPIP